MTTTPRKLKHDSENISEEMQGKPQAMGSMDELIATIMAAEEFKCYAAECPDSDMIALTRDHYTKILLGPKIWMSLDRRYPYLQSSSHDGISIICVGSEQDFAGFPPELRTPELQQLGLPISRVTLRAALQSVHNFQSLIAHSHAEAREVDEANKNVKYVMSISRELNGERDIPKLLNLILSKAREICNADAGSVYTVETHTNDIRDGQIRFRFTQNDSIEQNLSEFSMPVSEDSIVGNAVIHKMPINIPDLYKLSPNPEENPFRAKHDRRWDDHNGYESHSMLSVPLFNISHNVIGVIQLINRKVKGHQGGITRHEDFSKYVVPFDEIDEDYIGVVAQQAGIALENANFQENIEALFDGFVHASVTAIEQRDPTTSGHSHRVAHLTVRLAETLNLISNGPYGSTYLSKDQIKEIEYASLLHDFGKLGVRENVLVKAKKLYPWQFENLQQRFDLIRANLEIDYLRRMVEYLQNPEAFPFGANSRTFEIDKAKRVKELDMYMDFIQKANEPTVLEQGGFEKLKDIANLHFKHLTGEERPFLLSEELKALSVSRGSLTREEFAEIQSHVTHTYDFLREIPWGKRLANVPQIAAKHHEKLDGTGYPTSAGADEIPVQTRMMTIADIFDALTAADRPYKKAVPVERALGILEMEVKGGKLDPDLFTILCESRIYEEVLDPHFNYHRR